MLLNQFLLLGAFLFCTGIYGVLTRKHAVLVLMSIELMLAAVNVNLVAFGETTWRQPEFSPDWMFQETGGGDFCRNRALYSHRGVTGKPNLVYYDGHAKTKKWSQTMWPLTQNELINNPPTSDDATEIVTDYGWHIPVGHYCQGW